jgi:hypothetical protein
MSASLEQMWCTMMRSFTAAHKDILAHTDQSVIRRNHQQAIVRLAAQKAKHGGS